MGIILICLIPCLLLIISLIITKKVKVSTVTIIPNIVLLALAMMLDRINPHSDIAKEITSFKVNMFNISVCLLTIIITTLICIFSSKQINSKFKIIINTIIFLFSFVAELILIKMYFSCQ